MNEVDLMRLLVEPRVSEKATRVADAHRQFVFKVERVATKPDVKRAVELMFKVKVASVSLCNVRGKAKPGRTGRGGSRSSWKKAYVTLQPGFDINFIGKE